ncbi:MAG: hypothetical protein AB8F78_01635 [Saprospiraceae bacterium]
MKKLLLSSLFLFASLVILAQSFEGKIIYDVAYESKHPQMTGEQWGTMLGTQQDYYIKGNNYKSIMNGQMISWQLYNPTENRLYSKMTSPDVAYWTDARSNLDSVLSFTINEDAAVILGYSCDELILNVQSGKQSYFFAKKLVVDPADYPEHHFGNWTTFISHAKSLALKIVIDTDYFVSTNTAIEVSAEPIPDAFFVMDEGVEVKESPGE